MIKVPQPLAEVIMRYLVSKPYGEVAGIIEALRVCQPEAPQDHSAGEA